jgi:hypothetical protein
VVKPRDWMTNIDKDKVPRFYYIHKPAGSPAGMKFKGVEPTGPLPKSIDFGLTARPEPDTFSALFFGDTQPRDLREVDYLIRDIIEPLVHRKEKYEFGVTLGDVAFDDLNTFEPLMQATAFIGIPWYYVLGNHDINYDAADDHHSDETWERVFGPNYYSFDHGPVHFIALDNVWWTGRDKAKQEDPNRTAGYYRAALGVEQLDWFKRDLVHVPYSKLVVVAMHIPIWDNQEKADVYAELAKRPYALSVAAHTHFQEHRFLTEKDGWPGKTPHHHVVNVTTCGSWWSGAPDARGVPHTTMRDGAPHGYSIFSFDGTEYRIEYRAARRPADYQMNVIAPEVIAANSVTGTIIYANVFGGTERSKVEMSFAGRDWKPMERSVERDPSYVKMFDQDKALKLPYRALPNPVNSPHLWKADLLGGVLPGVYPLHIRTTDMFGQKYAATRAIRITGP